MTPSEAVKIVRTVLCRGMTHEQAAQLVAAMMPVTAEAGTTVLRQGERDQGLLVLVEGVAEVFKDDGEGGDVDIATLRAPSVIGEMSLITERPHSATIRARTRCSFQVLTRSQFDRLLKSESLAAYKLITTLAGVIAGRLISMDAKFVDLARRRDDPRSDELATFRHKLFSEWTE